MQMSRMGEARCVRRNALGCWFVMRRPPNLPTYSLTLLRYQNCPWGVIRHHLDASDMPVEPRRIILYHSKFEPYIFNISFRCQSNHEPIVPQGIQPWKRLQLCITAPMLCPVKVAYSVLTLHQAILPSWSDIRIPFGTKSSPSASHYIDHPTIDHWKYLTYLSNAGNPCLEWGEPLWLQISSGNPPQTEAHNTRPYTLWD